MKMWHIVALCAIGAAWHYQRDIIAHLPPSIADRLPAPSPNAQPGGMATGDNYNIPTLREGLPPFSVRSLDGSSTLDSGMLRGNLTLVTFFSGWCEVCKAQSPMVIEMKRQYPQLRVIGIVTNDTAISARQMLAQHGNPYDQVYMDTTGAAARTMRTSGVPNNFFIDTSGTLRYRHMGGMIDSDTVQYFVAMLGQLNAERAVR